jgi:hypothetical protein
MVWETHPDCTSRDDIAPTEPSPLNERIVDGLLKIIMAGGVVGVSAGAFWSLFKDEDIVKTITSAVIGLGISYGALVNQKDDERRCWLTSGQL